MMLLEQALICEIITAAAVITRACEQRDLACLAIVRPPFEQWQLFSSLETRSRKNGLQRIDKHENHNNLVSLPLIIRDSA